MPLWRTFISASLPFDFADLLIELMIALPICQGSVLNSMHTMASCSSFVSWITTQPRFVRVPSYGFWYFTTTSGVKTPGGQLMPMTWPTVRCVAATLTVPRSKSDGSSYVIVRRTG